MPINQKYQKDFLVCEILKLIFMLLLIVFFSLNIFAPIYKIIQGNEVTDECSGLDLITMFFQKTSSNIAPNDYGGALLTALFSILMAPYMLWRAILSVITLCQYDLYMEFQYCRELFCAMAGGTPIVFPAIAVCDGIAMGHTGMKYSLVTRDLIADSTEAMALAHGFDGLVMVPNCDKNVPGLLMATARVNIPTVFVSGGPMLAGRVEGKKTSLSSMFEAVGAYNSGKITDEKLYEYECKTCPTCGSCSGMYATTDIPQKIMRKFVV